MSYRDKQKVADNSRGRELIIKRGTKAMKNDLLHKKKVADNSWGCELLIKQGQRRKIENKQVYYWLLC